MNGMECIACMSIFPFFLEWPSWGPVLCLLLEVSSDYAQPIAGQVTEVTCSVIGQAQPEITPSNRPKASLDIMLSDLEGQRNPDSKVHGANMGPIWGGQDPGGLHVGPINFAIWNRASQMPTGLTGR